MRSRATTSTSPARQSATPATSKTQRSGFPRRRAIAARLLVFCGIRFARLSAMAALLQTIAPPRGRLIFVGDIHGCYDELRELLGRVAPTAADVVISVGDMVRKGPNPR